MARSRRKRRLERRGEPTRCLIVLLKKPFPRLCSDGGESDRAGAHPAGAHPPSQEADFDFPHKDSNASWTKGGNEALTTLFMSGFTNKSL